VLQLEIERCQRDEVEEISNILDETQCLSLTLTDKHDSPILEPELGTTPLWPDVIIQALYENLEEAELALKLLEPKFPNLDYKVITLEDEDWVKTCVDGIKPQKFGKRLWICPSWLSPIDPDAINLRLDPGLAFGTGTHPTTSLCLSWLEKENLVQKTIIDYGCGSGILALAALKLGSSHVDAVDIDEQALIATMSNAKINDINIDHLTIGLPEKLATPVDVLIANILLLPLMKLKTQFRQLLKDNGSLVVSGILKEQADELINIYADTFAFKTKDISGDWALLEFSCI
jgi:ribosomal protein L11 methyltransferase